VSIEIQKKVQKGTEAKSLAANPLGNSSNFIVEQTIIVAQYCPTVGNKYNAGQTKDDTLSFS
jgi:hypothetical protein